MTWTWQAILDFMFSGGGLVAASGIAINLRRTWKQSIIDAALRDVHHQQQTAELRRCSDTQAELLATLVERVDRSDVRADKNDARVDRIEDRMEDLLNIMAGRTNNGS